MKDTSHPIAQLFEPTVMVSGPPPGAINVRIGQSVQGPGGTWIPCATKIAKNTYCSGVFEVGPGRRQVCAAHLPLSDADEALARAIDLAACAAA